MEGLAEDQKLCDTGLRMERLAAGHGHGLVGPSSKQLVGICATYVRWAPPSMHASILDGCFLYCYMGYGSAHESPEQAKRAAVAM